MYSRIIKWLFAATTTTTIAAVNVVALCYVFYVLYKTSSIYLILLLHIYKNKIFVCLLMQIIDSYGFIQND